ncbi:MAG: 30S ribosomal protein S16 [Cyclobacteriaceae bacterium]|nr:30S ribosomal protein S16 [Cyclobacteriaceae bacterium]
MAVKIRLARRGRKKLARYDVVVTDARSPRDGKFIEKIGTYDPLTVPATINLNDEKAFDWLMKGAQPSDTVKAMLSYRGVMLKKHLQIGVVKGAISQEQADAKFAEWKKTKEEKIQSKRDNVSKAKQDSAKARREAEVKVKEARAEAIRKKAEAAKAAATAAEAPAAEVAPEAAAPAPAEEAQA